MNTKIVTVIVPRLPPSIDGLGDYGLNLAKQMRADFGVESEFIVCDPHWTGEAVVEGFKVKKIHSRSAGSLIALLPEEMNSQHTVILHYVGYGYAKRGSPVWLINGLKKWRGEAKERKLITMFHELFAFGPVWTSQFWTSPLQKYLMIKLAKISDQALTSKKSYAGIINKLTQDRHLTMPVLPVFSNVGEPDNLPPLLNRERRAVIFGSRGPRTRLYQQSHNDLQKVCKEFNIREILDIGPPLDFDITPINGINVKKLGVQSSEEISIILMDSMLGFVNYPTDYLCKSGIFAALCSHRILPFVSSEGREHVDSVVENVHFLGKNSSSSNFENSQVIADNAYHWYLEHNLSVHSKTFFGCL